MDLSNPGTRARPEFEDSMQPTDSCVARKRASKKVDDHKELTASQRGKFIEFVRDRLQHQETFFIEYVGIAQLRMLNRKYNTLLNMTRVIDNFNALYEKTQRQEMARIAERQKEALATGWHRHDTVFVEKCLRRHGDYGQAMKQLVEMKLQVRKNVEDTFLQRDHEMGGDDKCSNTLKSLRRQTYREVMNILARYVNRMM